MLRAPARSRHALRVAARGGLALTLAAWFALSACGSETEPEPEGPVVSTIVPPTTSGYVEARTSQIVTDGSGPSQVFDDFTFDESVTIHQVDWQGIYCVQTPGAGAPAPTASSFTISIYPDQAGRPNLAAPAHTSTYSVAQTDQTFEKNVSGLTCGTAANTTWPFYLYSVTLSSPFTAAAGTKYWLSIQATTPSYAVYFGWRDGRVYNNLSLQLFDGTYTTYDIDRAYSLTE